MRLTYKSGTIHKFSSELLRNESHHPILQPLELQDTTLTPLQEIKATRKQRQALPGHGQGLLALTNSQLPCRASGSCTYIQDPGVCTESGRCFCSTWGSASTRSHLEPFQHTLLKLHSGEHPSSALGLPCARWGSHQLKPHLSKVLLHLPKSPSETRLQHRLNFKQGCYISPNAQGSI